MERGRLGTIAKVHAVVPLLVAIPVLAGIAVVLGHILTTRYPDLGWSQAVANDGRALAAGVPIYGNPSHQYTGLLYTPLNAVLLAGLYRLFWWDGWAPVVSILATVALAGLVAGVAASGSDGTSRSTRIVGGIGVGGVALWIVLSNPLNLVFTGQVDQLAWLFALSGLCVLALSVAHHWPRVWPAVVLLTAAMWTKQPTVAAAIAAVLLVTWWASSTVTTWSTWRRFVGGLAITNVVTLVFLLALTRGWIWFSMFEIAARKPSDPAITAYVSEFARLLAIPLLAVAVVAFVGGRARAAPSSRSFVGLLSILLVAFLVVDVVPAMIGRRQLGAHENQYIGMMWALGLLLALAHREARKSRRLMTAGIAVYAAVALVVFVPPLRTAVSRTDVVEPVAVPNYDLRSIDPTVVTYARSHLVYESFFGVVSPTRTSEVWPHQGNLIDVLAAGKPVDYFVDALIERRFDAVTPFGPLAGAYVEKGGYIDLEYVPALNTLMHAGYALGANGAPPPLLGRRPGELDLSWARECFSQPHPQACVADGAKTARRKSNN